MKNILLLITTILAFNCFSQHLGGHGGGGSGGGGSSPAGAPSPGQAPGGATPSGPPAAGAASSQIQPGHHYIIRSNKFVKYIHHKMAYKPATTYSLIPVKVDGNRTIKDSSIIQYENGSIIKVVKGGSIYVPGNSIIQEPHDSLALTWIMDTINVYAREKLKVSVTQDSGDLHIYFTTRKYHVYNDDVMAARKIANKALFDANYKANENLLPLLFEMKTHQEFMDNSGLINFTDEFDEHKRRRDALALLVEQQSLANILSRPLLEYYNKQLTIHTRKLNKQVNQIDKGKNKVYNNKPTTTAKEIYKDEIIKPEQDSIKKYKGLISIEILKKDTVFSAPSEKILLTSNDVITARCIDPRRDSLQSFHLIIPRHNFLKEPIYYIKLPYHMIQYGATTIPFKYRVGYNFGTANIPNDASAGINIAGFLGWKFGTTKFYNDPNKTNSGISWIVAAFVGPTIIPLSATNTLPQTLPSQYSNQIGISYGGTVSFNYQSFNLGFYVGRDTPLGADARTWDYANKWWVGVGVGFNLGMLNATNTQSFN